MPHWHNRCGPQSLLGANRQLLPYIPQILEYSSECSRKTIERVVPAIQGRVREGGESVDMTEHGVLLGCCVNTKGREEICRGCKVFVEHGCMCKREGTYRLAAGLIESTYTTYEGNVTSRLNLNGELHRYKCNAA